MMDSILTKTATHQLHAWTFAVGLGCLVTVLVLGLQKETSQSKRKVYACLAIGLVGAVLGAALLPLLLRLPAALAQRSLSPLLVADRMALGGLVGFTVAAVFAARSLHLDVDRVLEQLAPSLGILVIFGRVGCFLEGCDFGSPTAAFWAVHYPPASHAFNHQIQSGLLPISAHQSLGVHPVQLVEAGIGIVMWIVAKQRLPNAFWTSLCVYSIGRFFAEFLRGDPRAFWGPFCLAQWLSIALFFYCAASLDPNQAVRKWRRS
ncbi:MAG: prolipoprotein diacylglyceryl transferase [Polyangiaceae bacterium]|nr:prolipoprotein diacylglyceryl transferase [Polyangiaceae bacterium]